MDVRPVDVDEALLAAAAHHLGTADPAKTVELALRQVLELHGPRTVAMDREEALAMEGTGWGDDPISS
jgi:Arc/MetJ family transcription regulator